MFKNIKSYHILYWDWTLFATPPIIHTYLGLFPNIPTIENDCGDTYKVVASRTVKYLHFSEIAYLRDTQIIAGAFMHVLVAHATIGPSFPFTSTSRGLPR